MTKTYNRFHDPDETAPDIARLRTLHADMDHAVLTAYGWCDIATELTATGCDFLPDYAIDDEEWAGKKKPYRYRWPNAIRDEVLARLLELNADRAAEEARTGTANRAKLLPGGSGPRPQRRHATRNRSQPMVEPRGLWEDNPPNEPDPEASASGQEGDEPDLEASVDGQED